MEWEQLCLVERDGSERPIGFASRTLSAAEKSYVQIKREGLAIIFAVKKFHNYLYGRALTIVTNHWSACSMRAKRCQPWPLVEYKGGR